MLSLSLHSLDALNAMSLLSLLDPNNIEIWGVSLPLVLFGGYSLYEWIDKRFVKPKGYYESWDEKK